MTHPDPVDVLAGARLRLRRGLMGMSQGQLGNASGLTFQQIQKYERGVNRMGASRLQQMATILGVSVAYFFGDENDAPESMLPGFAEETERPAIEGAPKPPPEAALFNRRETLELIRAYYRITDPRQRRKVFDLIRTLSKDS